MCVSAGEDVSSVAGSMCVCGGKNASSVKKYVCECKRKVPSAAGSMCVGGGEDASSVKKNMCVSARNILNHAWDLLESSLFFNPCSGFCTDPIPHQTIPMLPIPLIELQCREKKSNLS
jgi:hypothetical protein